MSVRAYDVISAGSVAGFAPMCDSAPSWRDQAACRGNVEPFFDPTRWPEARYICLGCEVRDECLDDALARSDLGDFRAGMAPSELAKVARLVRRPRRVSYCLLCAAQVSVRATWCNACRPKAKNQERRNRA